MMPHPEALRRRLTSEDPATPWLTWYGPFDPAAAPAVDASALARIELSRVTFDNWVAKAAGLLADEFDVDIGDEVGIRLRPHWLAPVWIWAVWSLGAAVVPVLDRTTVPLVIVDDPELGDPTGGTATVLLSSTHPMGLPSGSSMPAGWVDAMADIRLFPDVRSAPVPAADSTLIRSADERLDVTAAARIASAANPDSARRLLVDSPNLASIPDLIATTLAAALVDGATVVVTAAADTAVAQVSTQEHADRSLTSRDLPPDAGTC